jgi:hypothetical protein
MEGFFMTGPWDDGKTLTVLHLLTVDKHTGGCKGWISRARGRARRRSRGAGGRVRATAAGAAGAALVTEDEKSG